MTGTRSGITTFLDGVACLTMLRACAFSFTIISVLAVLLTGCSGSDTTTFPLEQKAPRLVSQDFAPAGKSVGDVVSFAAPVSRDGKVVGLVIGALTTAILPDEGLLAEEVEQRIALLVFRLGPDDTISVLSDSVYPVDQREMKPGDPHVRAVVGGTGEYIGARGQVTTTRNSNGTYVHEFELLK